MEWVERYLTIKIFHSILEQNSKAFKFFCVEKNQSEALILCQILGEQVERAAYFDFQLKLTIKNKNIIKRDVKYQV